MSESDFRDEGARREAERSAAADQTVDIRDPGEIDEDAMRAAEDRTAPAGVAKASREATKRGANVKGEGQIP